MKISKEKLKIVELYDRGYRVIEGIIYNPEGETLKGSIKNNGKGYHTFWCPEVYVHRFVAYQKYKDEWFLSNLLVRHLDGNSLNNLEYNIALGTYKDNSQDMTVEQRKMQVYAAQNDPKRIANMRKTAKLKRKISDTTVFNIRELFGQNNTFYKISKITGVNRGTVRSICLNLSYDDIQ